jgi:hypothetical protein
MKQSFSIGIVILLINIDGYLFPPGVIGEFLKKMEEWPKFTILQDNSFLFS